MREPLNRQCRRLGADAFGSGDYRQVNILLCSALAECIGTCGPALVEGRKSGDAGFDCKVHVPIIVCSHRS
jgi:hypothetical protein